MPQEFNLYDIHRMPSVSLVKVVYDDEMFDLVTTNDKNERIEIIIREKTEAFLERTIDEQDRNPDVV